MTRSEAIWPNRSGRPQSTVRMGGQIDRLGGQYGLPGRLQVIHAAGSETGASIVFSTAIIVAAFVPLFGLGRIEGYIFSPMAKTYAYALLGAVIATFTVSLALSALLLPANLDEKDTLVVTWMDTGRQSRRRGLT